MADTFQVHYHFQGTGTDAAGKPVFMEFSRRGTLSFAPAVGMTIYFGADNEDNHRTVMDVEWDNEKRRFEVHLQDVELTEEFGVAHNVALGWKATDFWKARGA